MAKTIADDISCASKDAAPAQQHGHAEGHAECGSNDVGDVLDGAHLVASHTTGATGAFL
jgi:hypothetical protein